LVLVKFNEYKLDIPEKVIQLKAAKIDIYLSWLFAELVE